MTVRCEGCGHPQGEGSWAGREAPPLDRVEWGAVLNSLSAGLAPPPGFPTHWSPCDEGCRHGGTVRLSNPVTVVGFTDDLESGALSRLREEHVTVEASWRQVTTDEDGTLCTRCRAEKARES